MLDIESKLARLNSSIGVPCRLLLERPALDGTQGPLFPMRCLESEVGIRSSYDNVLLSFVKVLEEL